MNLAPLSGSTGDQLKVLVRDLLVATAQQRGGQRLLSELSVTAEGIDHVTWSEIEALQPFGAVLEDRLVAFALLLEGNLALYVVPELRRQGIGSKLFAHYRQHVGTFDVQVCPGDRVAKNFCESVGFKARLLTMSAE